MTVSLQREAIGISLNCCKIVPAELGNSIGDVAAIAVGAN
jgi:hypothetical protein